MIKSITNTQFFRYEEVERVQQYAKENGLIALVYHETKAGKYKSLTKHMVTRRLNASGICFVDLIEKRSVTDWEVKQSLRFLSNIEK